MPRPGALPPLAAEVQRLRSLLPSAKEAAAACDADAGDSSVTSGGKPLGRGDRPVRVLCRFRGQTDAERQRGGREVWDLSDTAVSAGDPSVVGGVHMSFSYDRVFGPEATQAEVYSEVEPAIQEVLGGVNSAVLCYGQTSAGKTFTMEGLEGADCGEELRGIAQRAFATLFDGAGAGGIHCFRLSMLDIYQERLRDLLSPDSRADLKVMEDRQCGIHVQGLQEVEVTGLGQALDVLRRGQGNRATGATGMNDRSSRSHSIVILQAEDACRQRLAKLCLVDLAGSECLKKACLKANADADAKARQGVAAANAEIAEEAKCINQSLTVLALVINRLADRKRGGGGGGGYDPHVPYRSSKLTRVLQDTLGGNSRTVVIVNCAGSSLHASETMSTLRFGARAQSVVNTVTGHPASGDSLMLQTLQAARQEIERLHALWDSRGALPLALPLSSRSFSPAPEGRPSPLPGISPRRLSRAGVALTDPEANAAAVPALPRFSRASRSHRARESMGGSPRNNGDWSPLELSPRSTARDRRISFAGESPQRSCRPSVAGVFSPLALSEADGPGCRPSTAAHPTRDLQSLPTPARRRSRWTAPAPAPRARPELELASAQTWEYPLSNQEKVQRERWVNTQMHDLAVVEVSELKEDLAAKEHECREKEMNEGTLAARCCALQCDLEWALHRSSLEMSCDLYVGKARERFTAFLAKQVHTSFSSSALWVTFRAWGSAVANAKRAERDEELQRVREGLAEARAEDGRVETELRQEALRLKEELAQEQSARAGADERAHAAEEEAVRLKGELTQEQSARAGADDRVHAADEEAVRLKGELAQEQAARAGADERVHAAEEEAVKLKGELAQEQAARAGADERVQAAEEEALRLKGAGAQADERVLAAEEEAERLKGELAQEQAARAAADERVQAADQEALRLKGELSQEQAARAGADEQVHAASEEAERLKGELAKEQAARAGADERVLAADEEALRLRGELSQEQAARAGADEQVHAASEEALRLKGELSQEQAARAGADDQVRAAEEEAERLKRELAQEQSTRAAADERVQAAEQEALRLKGELSQEQAARAGADERIQASEEEALRLKGELSQEQAACAGADEQVHAAEEEAVRLKGELAREQAARAGADEQVQAANLEALRLKGELAQEQAARAGADEQVQAAEEEAVRLKGELAREQAARAGADEQVQAAELEALRLKGELAQEQAARAGADQQVQAIDVQARALGELSVELQRELERLREAATGAEALAAEGRAEASELRGRLQQERQASAEQGETLQRELSRVQGELFVRVEALRMGTERARRQRELSEEEVRCGQLETAAAKAEASRLQAQLETGELQRLQQQQELSTRLQDSQASAASAQGQAAAFEAKLKALAVKLEETAEASSGPPTPRWSGTDSAKEAVEAARAEKDAALQARREAQESKDAALLEAEAARDRERAALQEAESAQGERQAALREAEAAQGERQAALREAEAAQGERQAALREAEAAQGERQAALEEVARLEAQLGETAQQRLREAADSEQQRALEEEAPPLARRRHRRACAVLGGGVWRLAKLLLAQLLLRAALDAAGPADPVFAAYGPDALVARAYARGLAAFGSDGPAAGERGTAEAAAAAQDAGAGTEDPGERRRRERDALEEAERPSAEAGQAEEEEQVVEAAREEEHERFEPEVAQPPQQSPRGAPAEAAAPGEAAAEAPPTAAPGEAASDEPAGPEERGPGTAAAAAGSADPPPATGDGHDEAAANEPPVAPKAVGAAAAGGDGSEADATADATADGDEFPGAEKVQKPLAFVVFLATWVLYRPV